MTEKTFKFADQNNLPFYFVSAADGTNVVKVFNEALELALDNKKNPPDDYMNDVMELLQDVYIYLFIFFFISFLGTTFQRRKMKKLFIRRGTVIVLFNQLFKWSMKLSIVN